MQLSIQSFSGMVQNMAAAVQASASQALDISVGSTLRAVLEASGSVALWMQWLILQVLQATRASTSVGGDLDSWVADFSMSRLPASPASGMVTLSRFNPGGVAFIPVGSLVKTADGGQTFAVASDPTLQAWDPASRGYSVPIGVAAIDVPVVAQTAGAAGNIQAAAISLLATAIPGIDAVSNGTAFLNGIDAESDAALRLRFQAYMLSRSRATPAAIGFAISSVQQGLNFTLQENVGPSGNSLRGGFLITVDDGSGHPSTGLIAAVQQAVEAVRPIGSTYAVLAPVVVLANVQLAIATVAPGDVTSVEPAVVSAITAFINAIPVGAPLPWSRLAQIAYAADGRIENVTNILLNGAASDIVATPMQVIKPGAVTLV